MGLAVGTFTELRSPPLIGGVIPLIDVDDYLAGKPGAAEEVAEQLRYAFENVGFYYLAGHGVPQALIEAQYEQPAASMPSPWKRSSRSRSMSTRLATADP